MKIISIAKFLTFILAAMLLAIFLSALPSVSMESIYRMFADDNLIFSIVFGLSTSLSATFLSALFGIPAGYYLARNKRGISSLLDAFFDIPLLIPPLIVGIMLLTFFNLSIVKYFYNFIFTFEGAMLAQFFVAFPFTVKISKSAFELIPPVYERIAMTLGAPPFRSFWDTTFKLASGAIFSGLLLSWLRCLGEFGATLMVGGGISGKTSNIPIQIYLDMTEGDFSKGITLSLLVALTAFLITVLVRGFLAGNKKGI